MRIDFNFSGEDLAVWNRACEALLSSVGDASRMATEQALWEVSSDSLQQVPIETGTLASSLFMGVAAGADVSLLDKARVAGVYAGVIGYGEYQDIAGDLTGKRVEWLKPPEPQINPDTGLAATVYANRVHEDLYMLHPVGKAKFLEDPILNYAMNKLEPMVTNYWQHAFEWVERAPDKALWESFKKAYKDTYGSPRQYTDRQIKDQVRALKRSEPFKGKHVIGPEGNERFHSRIIRYSKATHEPIVKFTRKKSWGGYRKKRLTQHTSLGNKYWKGRDIPF